MPKLVGGHDRSPTRAFHYPTKRFPELLQRRYEHVCTGHILSHGGVGLCGCQELVVELQILAEFHEPGVPKDQQVRA